MIRLVASALVFECSTKPYIGSARDRSWRSIGDIMEATPIRGQLRLISAASSRRCRTLPVPLSHRGVHMLTSGQQSSAAGAMEVSAGRRCSLAQCQSADVMPSANDAYDPQPKNNFQTSSGAFCSAPENILVEDDALATCSLSPGSNRRQLSIMSWRVIKLC